MGERALQRLVVCGTSFREVGFGRLAALVVPPEDRERGAIAELARELGAFEAVYVATCNRAELYLALRPEAPRDVAAHVARWLSARTGQPVGADAFFLHRGEAAIAHLFRVGASLESLALGECEILGQVRRAVEEARAQGTLGERLNRLFRQAQRAAKTVRGATAIGRTPVSIASLTGRAIRDHFRGERIERCVLVGVGDMTRKVANGLKGDADLLFVNRTLARAEELAARVGGRAQSLDSFRASPPRDLDVLVTATSASRPVIGAPELAPALAARRKDGPARRPALLVCDLGLPPDVDPALETGPGLRRLALADLEVTARHNQAQLEGEAARARALVGAEAERFARRYALSSEAEESVEALIEERMAHLGGGDRETLRRFALGLADRLAAMR